MSRWLRVLHAPSAKENREPKSRILMFQFKNSAQRLGTQKGRVKETDKVHMGIRRNWGNTISLPSACLDRSKPPSFFFYPSWDLETPMWEIHTGGEGWSQRLPHHLPEKNKCVCFNSNTWKRYGWSWLRKWGLSGFWEELPFLWLLIPILPSVLCIVPKSGPPRRPMSRGVLAKPSSYWLIPSTPAPLMPPKRV